jgi:transposase-like protein
MPNTIKRKPHSAEFRFKVAIEAIRGDKTTAELCQDYGVVSSQVFKWKKTLLESGKQVFSDNVQAGGDNAQVEKLHATIGRLKVENDFLLKCAGRNL